MATVSEPRMTPESFPVPDSDREPRSWKELMPHGISSPVMFWLAIVHLGALLIFVPSIFSWWSVGLALVLHWLTGGIGVCLGYHRLFTHRSFKTTKPVRYLLALIGGLAGEGSCLNWVCTHRRHHAFSDDEGDPHSPHDGAWWAHMFWTFGKSDPVDLGQKYRRWIPDLCDDKGLKFLDLMFIPNHLISAGLLFLLGNAMGGKMLGCSFVVWGVFARLVFVMHSTWLVNSASHMWGYRNYETTDDSRNNWFVALLTYGEGWHNNHHAYPTMARHGHKWWEVDVTFMTIRLMEMCGLAWDVVDNKHKKRAELATVKNVSTDAVIQAHQMHETGNPRHEPSRNVADVKA